VAVAAAAVAAVLLLGSSSGSGPTPAETKAAEAINLRASDLPGFSIAPHQAASPQDHQFDTDFNRCIGPQASNSGGVDLPSPTFIAANGAQVDEVSSDVSFATSSSTVTRALALIHAGTLGGCLVQALDGATFTTSGGVPLTIGNANAISMQTRAPGSVGSFGVRTSMTISGPAAGLPASMDALGFAVGRKEITLTAFTIGQPFPTGAEQRLYTRLLTRTLAQQP
jgi:hypothetical protein